MSTQGAEMQPPPETCVQCGHPEGPHLMVATREDPMYGGIRLCPQCDCFATWDVPPFSNLMDVRIPDAAELAAIRAKIRDV